MNQAEIIGAVVLAIITIGGLIAAVLSPFTKLTEAINRLVISVELLKQTVEVFKDLFEKQEDINEKFHKKIAKIERDILDVQHNCQLVHKQYYKDKS